MIRIKMNSVIALAAVTIAVSAVANPAHAKPKFYPKPVGYYHPQKHSYAPLAAGVIGALALGAAAAAASAEDCYIEERERIDAYGNSYIREVRVCD